MANEGRIATLDFLANQSTVADRLPVYSKMLFDGKAAKSLSFETIAKHLDRSEVACAALFYGQATASPEDINRLSELLDLPKETLEAQMTGFPNRGQAGPMPPVEPLIYRLYEIVQNYGYAYKAILNEKFGDGIMSAICFSTTVDKEVDEAGSPWVVITLKGKCCNGFGPSTKKPQSSDLCVWYPGASQDDFTCHSQEHNQFPVSTNISGGLGTSRTDHSPHSQRRISIRLTRSLQNHGGHEKLQEAVEFEYKEHLKLPRKLKSSRPQHTTNIHFYNTLSTILNTEHSLAFLSLSTPAFRMPSSKNTNGQTPGYPLGCSVMAKPTNNGQTPGYPLGCNVMAKPAANAPTKDTRAPVEFTANMVTKSKLKMALAAEKGTDFKKLKLKRKQKEAEKRNKAAGRGAPEEEESSADDDEDIEDGGAEIDEDEDDEEETKGVRIHSQLGNKFTFEQNTNLN
ncbi:hypothetical protein NM208_g3220 [Fusarium decemcellulare]|uniref:Uncharacterized protein n=1 Tax=Fusarium decemcellulare TaxID=57161 RepID=A0ACC1SPR5_9HYPO|nr:hypothetical protein NM208_g3220 [Fusarium decemcellulare]